MFLLQLLPIILVFIGLAAFLHFVPLGLWISALAAGVRVGIITLIGMRLRRVPPVPGGLPHRGPDRGGGKHRPLPVPHHPEEGGTDPLGGPAGGPGGLCVGVRPVHRRLPL